MTGDATPRAIYREDLTRFKSLVDQYNRRADLSQTFEEWLKEREAAVAALRPSPRKPEVSR